MGAKVLRWIGLIIAILIALTLLPIALWQIPQVRGPIVRYAVGEIDRRIPGSLTFEKLEGNLIRSLEVRGVRYVEDGIALTVERLALRWDPLALLRRGVHVQDLLVEGAVVRIDTEAGDASEVRQDEEGAEPGAWSLRVDRLRVRSSRVEIVEEHTTRTAELDQVTAGVVWESPVLEVGLASAAGRFSDPHVDVRAARGAFQLRGDGTPRVVFSGLALELAASQLFLDGEAALCAGEPIRFQVRGAPLAPADLASLGWAPGVPVHVDIESAGRWPEVDWSLQVTSAAGRADAAGSLTLPFTAPCQPDFEKLSFSARGSLGDVVPARFVVGEWVEDTQVSADFALAVTHAGSSHRQVWGSFSGDRSRIAGQPVRLFQGRMHWQKEVLAGRVEMDAVGSRFLADGWVNFATEAYAGSVRMRRFNPGPWVGSRWAGAVNAEAAGEGRGFDVETLRLTARVTATPSRIGPIEISRAAFPLRMRDNRLFFDDVEVASNVADVRLSGHLPLSENGRGEIRLLARTEDAGTLSLLVGETSEDVPGAHPQAQVLGGRGYLRVTARGSLQSLDFEAELRAEAIRYASHDAAVLMLDMTGRGVNPRLRTGRAEALMRLGAPRMNEFTLDDLSVTASVDAGVKRTEGTVLVEATLDGERNALRGQFEIEDVRRRATLEELDMLIGGERWRSSGEATFDLRKDTLVIENLDLRSGEQRIHIHGELDPGASQDVTFEIHRVQLAPLWELLQFEQALTGQLDAVMVLRGTVEKPQLSATVALAEVRYEGVDVAVATAQVDYADEVLNTNIRLLHDMESGVLHADFTLPLPVGNMAWADVGGRVVTGRIHADDLQLRLLQPLLNDVGRIRNGLVALDLTVAGTLGNPQIHGSGTLAGGAFHVQALETEYTDIQAALSFHGTAIILERFRATSGDGLLEGSASLAMPALGEFDALAAEIRARRLLVMDTRLVSAVADADLRVAGTWGRPNLTGGVDLREVVVRPETDAPDLEPLAFTLPGMVVVAPAESKIDGAVVLRPAIEVPFLERLGMRVTLRADRNIWVRNEEISLEWQGRVEAFKSHGEGSIRLVGNLQPIRGFILVHGRRLRLDEGNITFLGTPEIDPGLDLTFSYDARDYLISTHVTGTTRMPRLTFSSEPPLEEADILAVLLFGRPFHELGAGEQSEMRDRVGGLLGGFAANQLRRAVGGRLPVDVLEIDPAAEGPALGVGKYVTENIFLEYIQRFGAEAESELRLEYYFTRRWLLATSASTSGESGIDVFWETPF